MHLESHHRLLARVGRDQARGQLVPPLSARKVAAATMASWWVRSGSPANVKRQRAARRAMAGGLDRVGSVPVAGKMRQS